MTTNASPTRDAPMQGLALMVGASVLFSLMNAVTSWLGREGIPWETCAFSRAAGGLIVAFGAARVRGVSLKVRDRRRMWERSVAGSVSMLCTYYALTHMPLADATALLNTSPLWIALLAFVTLRESAGRSVLLALGIAFVGILFVERPSALRSNATGLVALSAGVTTALAMVTLRRLRDETPEAVVVHFSLFATVVTTILLGLHIARSGGHPSIAPSHWVGLATIGASATVGQLLMTRAYALDRAARVGAAGWLQIVFGLGIDLVFLHRQVPGLTLLGIALLVVAGVLLVVNASREAQAAKRVSTN